VRDRALISGFRCCPLRLVSYRADVIEPTRPSGPSRVPYVVAGLIVVLVVLIGTLSYCAEPPFTNGAGPAATAAP
jgi:hypothetical protein